MNVLVTGATGFVGEAVLAQLHRSGHRIRALVRDSDSPASRKIYERYSATLVQGNILDRASLRSFFTEGDAFIHLVGIISEIGNNTFEAVHHQGTANVVAFARESGIRRFIHMSALGTRERAVSRYHQSKWAGEESVRSSGLDYTIFRPSIIYGPGDAFTTLFARMARWSPIVPVIGTGEGTVQPVPVELVANCFVAALTNHDAKLQTFDLVGPEVLTMNEVIAAILEATGKRAWKWHLPLAMANANARLLEFVWPKLFRKAAPLNQDQIIMLQEQTQGDEAAAHQVFGVKAPPFREGLNYLRPIGG